MKLLGDTPYDEDVRDLAREKCLSLDRARDRFIWVALQMGEVGPLVCFLLRGYVPGLAVRQHVALMLVDSTSASDNVHYRLVVKSRGGKHGPRRSNFLIALRQRKYRKRVRELMEEFGRGSYLAAIKQVAGESGLSEQTIRDAYDQGKRSRK
jgi:hypothetical protein